ncbi:hypothetical protein GXW82_09555 [Streptacidiphilus sp. 4-A2]|nr:hypothetical protein [Streptacidiphilus sp. 4-A2]
MTVIDAQGNAYCFPKPLTISAHTLRAVQADDLTPREWRRLQLQSRLHSKSGRSFAVALSRFNLPIIGINAIVQRLVRRPSTPRTGWWPAGSAPVSGSGTCSSSSAANRGWRRSIPRRRPTG